MTDEFGAMDDPALLAERRKVADQISDGENSAELTARYRALNDEFLRRASATWTKAS